MSYLSLERCKKCIKLKKKMLPFCFVLTNRMVDVILILRKVQEVYQAEEKDVAILFCANKQNDGCHTYP